MLQQAPRGAELQCEGDTTVARGTPCTSDSSHHCRPCYPPSLFTLIFVRWELLTETITRDLLHPVVCQVWRHCALQSSVHQAVDILYTRTFWTLQIREGLKHQNYYNDNYMSIQCSQWKRMNVSIWRLCTTLYSLTVSGVLNTFWDFQFLA